MTSKLEKILEGNQSQEIQMLDEGAIISQVPEGELKLTTVGQIGKYIVKTGYIKLIDGRLSDKKGEFISVKVLVDDRGIIRYTKSELVGFPDSIGENTGRKELTTKELQELLEQEGYDIEEVEELSEEERQTYRAKIEEEIEAITVPVAYGTIISKPKDSRVAGIAKKVGDVFIDKYASPENIVEATKKEVSIFEGGSYSSHAGIVLREYDKTSIILNEGQVTKEGMRIKFYEYVGEVEHEYRISK